MGNYNNDLVFKTQNELYNFLLPVLMVKERVNKYYGYDISSEKIWNYLGKYKWKNCKNLSLAEIVNDIIILDMINMKGKMMSYE